MTYKLFLIVSPGFEAHALKELESKCPVSSVLLTKGGIELTADLNWIVRAHCLLKIPTRILLRIESFKVKDFPKLHQKLSKIKWNQFLSHPNPHWEVSSSKSRLLHTGRIAQTAKEALEQALDRQPLSLDWKKKNYSPQTFYIRIHNDELTLSLDLTGEPLYKRGVQIFKGKAPLRENIAAALLMDLLEGLTNDVILVDPMCGSGTFITEAQHFHLPLHIRSFAFEEAPFFKGHFFRMPDQTTKLPLEKSLGFDINQELLEKINAHSNLYLVFQDSLKKSFSYLKNIVIICNPPYGERIEIQGKRGGFLKTAWNKFLTIDQPKRLGWLVPSDMDDLFKDPVGYKLFKKNHFKNGGLPVTFWVWEKD